MKKALLFLSLFTIVSLACGVTIDITPNAEAPTADSAPVMVEPATTTPEVFNPLNPSPTPSGSDLPMTCQVTDLNVYIDRTAGYCYAYPKRFTYGSHPMFNVPAVQGPAIGGATDPVFATFTVEVVPVDPNRSLDQQVDQFLREFTVVAPESLTRARLTVGGEPAVMVVFAKLN